MRVYYSEYARTYFIGPIIYSKKISIKLRLSSYPSVPTCVLGAQKNRLIETVLLSTHNICCG